MKCDHARQALAERVDGLLMPIDRAALAEHVRGCAACARAEAEVALLVAGLDRLPDPAVPSGFTQSVMQQLPEMLPAEHGTKHLLRWGVAAAVLVFAFLAGLGLLLDSGGPDVAHQLLGPVAASFQLAGLLLAHAATATAALIDATSTAIVTTHLGAKLAFALAFVAVNAALVGLLSRYRPLGRAPARRG